MTPENSLTTRRPSRVAPLKSAPLGEDDDFNLGENFPAQINTEKSCGEEFLGTFGLVFVMICYFFPRKGNAWIQFLFLESIGFNF